MSERLLTISQSRTDSAIDKLVNLTEQQYLRELRGLIGRGTPISQYLLGMNRLLNSDSVSTIYFLMGARFGLAMLGDKLPELDNDFSSLKRIADQINAPEGTNPFIACLSLTANPGSGLKKDSPINELESKLGPVLLDGIHEASEIMEDRGGDSEYFMFGGYAVAAIIINSQLPKAPVKLSS